MNKYIDNRVIVSGKKSKINQDNFFNLKDYILTTIFGSGSAANPLTFDNGLTLSATNVAKLGGILTANTTIVKDGFNLGVGGVGSNIFTTINSGNPDVYTRVSTTDTEAQLYTSDNGASVDTLIKVQPAGIANMIATDGTTSSNIFSTITGTGMVLGNGTYVANVVLDGINGTTMAYDTGLSAVSFSLVPDIGDGNAGAVLFTVPTYADEAAATAANLVQGAIYKTALGQLMIKL